MHNKRMSIVIPCYNEDKILRQSFDVISRSMLSESIDFDIIAVDDGSTDHTWSVIKSLSEGEMKGLMTGVRLSRNFGKESAIFAGIEAAKGDCCAIMDCDLQQPPDKLVEMYRIWENQEIDIVEGIKNQRQNESFFHRLFAGLFYTLLKLSSGFDLKNTSDFKLLDRKVVKILLSMQERNTFFRAMPSWMGFSKADVYYDVGDRAGGNGKWTTLGLFRFAIGSIISYTSVPMQLVTFFGFVFFIFAIALFFQSIYMKLSGHAVEGFTTVILLLLMIGSVIMFSLGIIGIYISKIYNEIKFRPRYLIRETAGRDSDEIQ